MLSRSPASFAPQPSRLRRQRLAGAQRIGLQDLARELRRMRRPGHVGRKRPPPRQQLIEQHAECIHVGGGGDGLAAKLLRAGMRGRQHALVGAREARDAVDQPRDVPVLKARKNSALDRKALAHRRRNQRGVEQLDGGALLVGAVGALGQVDRAHAAVGQVGDDAPWAEKAAFEAGPRLFDQLVGGGADDVGGAVGGGGVGLK
jgi:hypothetical protein